MSTIAELTLPAEEFALGRTFEAVPDAEVEAERVVASEPRHVMPYVWFSPRTGDLESLDDALRSDPSVESVELLSVFGDERLYRTAWTEDVTVLIRALTRESATVLRASGAYRRWRLRVLFSERDSLSRTYDVATDEGFTVTIEKIRELETERRGRRGLTDAQYETLAAALEQGYYQIPRDIDMENLSETLGISHQALSERLRRAHRAVVEDAITIDSAGAEDDG